MARKIIYLINPIAGAKEKLSLRETLVRKTSEQNIDFDIVFSNPDGEYRFLVNKVQVEKFTDVVVCGGDGTVNAVVSALREIKVNIGIIPMGSGNGLAFAAKIPKQINRALAVIFRGKASFVDGFTINDQFSYMLCGIGFDALVAHKFAEQKKRGMQTYAKVSAINYFKAKPYLFEIEVGGRSFSTEAFLICIANSNQFGNHVTIAPQARLQDGLLDIVIVNKMSKFTLPFFVIGQLAGMNTVTPVSELPNKKNVMYFQTDSLSIHNRGLAPLHIDGEPRDTTEKFRIGVIKDCFLLLQP
jgi:diacylglycerol kinase (ATP)